MRKAQFGLTDVFMWIMMLSMIIFTTIFAISGNLGGRVQTSQRLLSSESSLLTFGSVTNFLSTSNLNYSLLCSNPSIGTKCYNEMENRPLKMGDYINYLSQNDGEGFKSNNVNLQVIGMIMKIMLLNKNGYADLTQNVGSGKDYFVLGYDGVSGDSIRNYGLTVNATAYYPQWFYYAGGAFGKFAVEKK